jgi:uncharacterized protein (DUF58 family)
MSILPTRRLLWLVLGAAALAVASGPMPEIAPVWLLGLFAVGLAALGDLCATLARPRVEAAAGSPVTRFTKGRTGSVRVSFACPPGSPGTVRFALGMPEAFEPERDQLWVSFSPGARRAEIDWRCTPSRRGRFGGVLACTECPSRLGLWQVRTRQPLATEMRVYPGLPLAAQRLLARTLRHGPAGVRAHRLMGRGREFEKLRDYLPGDGFDEIHWKATAKRGRPMTKVFQIERTQELYVVIDQSRLSGRMVPVDGAMQTVLEGYLSAALVLMRVAERQGDRFGMVTHDDRVRFFLRAGHSQAHYAACRDAAMTLQPSDHTPDVAEIVRHLCTHLRRRALLIFLTDLSDPVLAEDFARNIRVLSRRHLVCVCQTRPPDVGPLFEGGPVGSEREIYGRLAGHIRWRELRAAAQRLCSLGVSTRTLERDLMAAGLVDLHAQVKRRQIL